MVRDDVTVVLCGEAGQGIQTVEDLLTPILNCDMNIAVWDL